MAANIFTGATNSNWNTSTNWSLGTVPTSSDGHVATFDATSPSCTVNVSAVCNAIDWSGYTNTITMTNGITVSGNVTLDSTMASRVSGSGALTVNATSTLTSNGGTWVNALTMTTASTTITLGDNWTVNGLITLGSTILNGNTLNIGTSFTQGAESGGVGTTLLKFIGTGTWGSSTSNTRNSITIDTAGTITLGTNTAMYDGTLTHLNGIVVTTGNTFYTNTNTIFNCSGITFNTISVGVLAPLTLLSNIYCINLIMYGHINGLFNIYVSGNFTHNFNLGIGSSTIIMNGAGTWNGGGGFIQQKIILTGNITVTGSPLIVNGELTTTGATVNAGTSTLGFQNVIANTSNVTWYNLSIYGGTNTLLSDINVSNNLTNVSGYTSTVNGLFNINVSGSLVGTGVSCLGTATIRLIGTGTWSGATVFRNNLTINTSGTITISGVINYNTGTLTYTSGTVVTTGSTLTIAASTTLNTNGVTWNNITFITTNSTITLLSDLISTGTIIHTNAATITFNGFNFYIAGNISLSNNRVFNGTTKIIFNTSTSQTISVDNSTVGGIRNNLDINATGTVNIVWLAYGTGTLTYISGNVVTTGSTLAIAASATLNTIGITWNNVSFQNAVTLTNNSILTMTGTLSLTSTVINGSDVYIGGGLTSVGTNSGTSNLIMNGTGTWSGTGTLRNNLTINTTGTITISGFIYYNTGTLTYTSGTVITTTSTLTIGSSTTLNTNGINWNNVTITTGTITNNSLLTINGTLILASSGNVIFAGTHGFTTNSLSCVTAGRTITFKDGVTYTVNSSLTLTGTSGSRITVNSSTTSYAYLTLAYGATQNVTNTNATWINSGGGDTIKSSFGTLSNTVNWQLGQGSWWQLQ